MLQEITQFMSQHPILGMTWVLLLVTVIIMTCKSRFSKVKQITRHEAIHLINKESAIIVDTRNPDDYRKGHIASSINLSAIDIKNKHLKELEAHRKQPVIIVCANGISCRTPAENLSKANFEHVFVLKDGITGWNNENLPLSRSRGN